MKTALPQAGRRNAGAQPLSQTATSLLLDSSANPSVFGQPVTYIARITGGMPGGPEPTGRVTFHDGGISLGAFIVSNAAVNLTPVTLKTGTHVITADYSGDANFASSSSSFTQIVNRAGTTVTLSASPPASAAGVLVTFTASVAAVPPGAGTPTGFVSFEEQGMEFAKSLLDSSAQAILATAGLPAGTHLITAVYMGDSSFDNSASPPFSYTVQAPPPTLQAYPLQVSFAAQSQGAMPAPQHVAVLSSVPGTPVNVSVSGAVWLSVPTGSMTAPASIVLAAGPGSMPAGVYQATVTITGQTVPPTQVIEVTFVVSPAPAQPTLGMQPASLSFSVARNGSPVTQPLTLTAAGGSINFSAAAATQDGGSWLSVSPASGVVSPDSFVGSTGQVNLSIQVDPAGLNPGVYRGSVVVNGVPVPVTVFVQGAQPGLALEQTGLTFNAVTGGGALSQVFGIAAIGNQAVAWTAQPSTLSGGSWLAVSPDSGTSAPDSPAPRLTVTADATGLAAGTYYGAVQVASSQAGNAPLEATIVLNVLPAGSVVPPVLQPAGLIFAGASGSSVDPQTVQVSGLSSGLTVSLAQATLEDAPVSVTVTSGPPAEIQVQPDTTGLGAGVRQGALLVQFSDGTVQSVQLVLAVGPGGSPAAGSAARQQVAQAAGACTPTNQFPVFTQLGPTYDGFGFGVPGAWPVPVEVKVVDDCANVLTGGTVVTTFSNGDPPLNMTSMGDGRWGATWQPQSAAPSLTVNSTIAGPPAAALQATGSVIPNAGAPVLAGVVNSASFIQQAPLAPGTLVSLFGSGLAASKASAQQLPLPTQLGGNATMVLGEALPLLYASDGQVNAQIPYDVPPGQPVLMWVRSGTAIAGPVALTVAAASPAVFTTSQTGSGQGVIVDARSNLVQPGNAAKANDIITIYCTGLGAIDPPVAAGAAAPATPLSRTVNPVTATIGGVPATVQFAGLTPGLTGLYQVNAVVPGGVTGNAVIVQLSVAGQLSPPVTIALQ